MGLLEMWDFSNKSGTLLIDNSRDLLRRTSTERTPPIYRNSHIVFTPIVLTVAHVAPSCPKSVGRFLESATSFKLVGFIALKRSLLPGDSYVVPLWL